jgi:uncharacterized membrane protein
MGGHRWSGGPRGWHVEPKTPSYVCMCVCVYVFMCVCLYVCMYVCMYVCIYVCMLCMYVWMYICLYVCMHENEDAETQNGAAVKQMWFHGV